jgi:putative spermidine/putrescine transport system substrate-binding protein
MRQNFIRMVFATVLAVAFISGAPTVGQSADPLVVSIWGGHWKEAVEQAVGIPFTRATGIPVEYEVGETTQRLAKARATKGNPQADVTFTTSHVARLYNSEGMLEPIPRAALTNAKDVIPDAFKGDYAVGLYATAYALAVRTDMVKEPITSWKDLWSPALKGKVILPAFDPSAIIIAAARLEGGDEFAWEKGWERLRALKPNVAAFYATGVQSIEMMRRGEAAVALMNSPNVNALQKEGVPVTLVIPKEKAIVTVDVITVLRGTKKKDAAIRFVDFALSPDVQGKIGMAFGATPTSTKAVLSEEFRNRPGVFDTKEKWAAQAHIVNDEQRAKMLDAWKERFQRDIMAR